MVHADASNFQSTTDKREVYAQILREAEALFEDQRNWVANTANTASLLWHGLRSLPPPTSAVNWAGFYVVDPKNASQLILGPFHGKVACQTIAFGRGVCGQAAKQLKSVLVSDVHSHPDHIACDSETASELVVPIIDAGSGKVLGVIDLDCSERDGFDAVDQEAIEELAALLARSCDWY